MQKLGVLFLAITLFAACEKDITLDLPQPDTKLVIEGHIEQGQPAYVILTTNTSYFNETSIADLSDLFVHDAHVVVSDGQQEWQLTEYCLSNLPQSVKDVAYQLLGIDPDLAGNNPDFDICAYLNFQLQGEVNTTYTLTISTPEDTVTAVTSIPGPVGFDSLWTTPEPGQPDSLLALWGMLDEPDSAGNYYRLFTQVNDNPFYPGIFGSVADDKLTNGQEFSFRIDRGWPRTADIDFETFAFFEKGDTVVVKLASVDRAHYRFWRTYEEQLLSGGPFATPSYIQGNVNGGLGIWGGYGAAYDTIIIPK